MPQVLNKRTHGVPEGAVYIGRPSKWGNPYHTKPSVYGPSKLYTKAEAIRLYEMHIKSNKELKAALHELRGKDLVCWCAPAACHGDILLRLANESE